MAITIDDVALKKQGIAKSPEKQRDNRGTSDHCLEHLWLA